MDMTTAPQPVTRAAAIGLVTQGLRGDFDGVRYTLDPCDIDEFVPPFHASLTLVRGVASRLRSPEGLMAVDVWLAETSHDEHRSREARLAAQLILSHAMTTCYPPDDETSTAAETFDLCSIGADNFNAVCYEADYDIVTVFVLALSMWRTLLPEVDTAARACIVGNVAGQLWGGSRSAGPPKTIQNPKRTTLLKQPKVDTQRELETRAAMEPDPPRHGTACRAAPGRRWPYSKGSRTCASVNAKKNEIGQEQARCSYRPGVLVVAQPFSTECTLN